MKAWIGGLAVALAVASPAHADGGLTDDQVTGALENQGFEPELASEDAGSFWTGQFTTSGGMEVSFVVRPYNCVSETGRCSTFNLFANFNADEASSSDMRDKLNHYNDTYMLGRGFALSNAVGVDYVVIVDGDLGTAFFERRIAEFPDIVADFLKVVNDEEDE